MMRKAGTIAKAKAGALAALLGAALTIGTGRSAHATEVTTESSLSESEVFVLPEGITTEETTETEYAGLIDSFTGEPVEATSTGEDGEAEFSTRVMVTNTMYFDTAERVFLYPLGNGDTHEITSNVADGMIVTGTVTLKVPEGISATLYRNGNAVTRTETITAVGNYSVFVEGGSGEERLLTFTIVGERTGLVNGYTLPTGFRVTDATRDGEQIPWERGFVSMEEEGKYTIVYECDRTEREYTLTVTIDHTPPQLILDGVGEDGKAHGPVTISGLESGDTMTVTRDGETVYMLENKLTTSGRYVITATDDADNTATYQFTIMVYLDSHGGVFLILLAGVIAAVAGFLIYSRKKMRVR